MEKPIEYFDNNVYGTQVLLQVMTEYDVDKIIFSSTAATYGETDVVPITEDIQPAPTNAYGETKLTMEKMMHWCEVAYEIGRASCRERGEMWEGAGRLMKEGRKGNRE